VRSATFWLAALVCAATGCAGRAVTTLETAVPEGSEQPAGQRLGALQVGLEAWPDGSGADALVDGRLDTAFTTEADLRGPWNFVVRIASAPADVAAIGLPVDGLATDPAEVAVFSLLGAWDLTHETWAHFVENAERHGLGVVPRTPGVVVFALDEWTPAHMVWLRVHTARAADSLRLSEIYVFSADQLVALREDPPAGYNVVQLLAVDTDPYQGINLTGLPTLDGPDLIENDGSGAAPAEGSE
jgi:hypothetical protein